MTEPEAFAIVANIVARTQGWDDAAVAAWVDDLRPLRHQPATTAARQLVDNHTNPGRPMWAAYRANYLRAVELDQPPQLRPSRLEEITLAEHIRRCRERADEQALAPWRRLAAAVTRDPAAVPPAWRQALTDLHDEGVALDQPDTEGIF